MTTVLVTGPIGSGKSTACRYLFSRGYPVYDCDSRCKRLYEEVPGLKEKIEEELGIPFSELYRIFEDESLRLSLEAIVYPLLVEDLKRWKASKEGFPLLFVESAIALDKPCFYGLWDSVLLIDARKSLRLKRNENARRRDAIQSFDPSKVDVIVRNDGSREALYKQLDDYLQTKI